ncbi:MAG: extracellular solute-binding protein [Candidatus Dormibacteria bacterium]
MPHHARARGALALMVLAGLFLASCGGSRGNGTTLILYNGQHPETTSALVQAFQKETGIQVQVRSNDEDVLVDQIVEEGGDSPADVIYTENSPALMYLEQKGRLADLPQSTLAQVPRRDSGPRGDWVGVSARVSVLVYNTRLLRPDQLPTSALALANPRWRGLIGIAPSETDFQPIVTSIAHSRGTAAAVAWLRGLAANAEAHVYPDDETITARVNSGQIAIGIVNHYYWYRLRQELGAGQMQSRIAYFAPGDPGYLLDISGAAVLKSSTHKAAAERFLAFLVSQRGQEILAKGDSFEYPLRPDVVAAKGLPPLRTLKPASLSVAQLGDGAEAVRLLRQAGLI